jgi:hypothetical protein
MKKGLKNYKHLPAEEYFLNDAWVSFERPDKSTSVSS